MQIIFLLYDGMTALDLVGPHEILCRLPGAKVQRVAERPGLIHTDSGLMLSVEYALSDISHADILVIPGAGNATTLKETPETLDWIRSIHATTTWTASVCTGSLILGAAGILAGLRATTHWAAFDRLEYWDAKPTHGRIVEDGKVITAAGVSAGIDMALNLAIKVAGVPFAQATQLGMEYDPEPPFDVGSPEKADSKIRNALQERMTAVFEPK
ncbi:MAG TPA: DJ-1/PfpI family protein [Candidatus Rhabdochlamydia sp.]|jgi:transcriptional regulator GlxA family with amidase domain|nr:DJ-1/PfpI family protein [Candidatus Rhabdochlamydia sp.]